MENETWTLTNLPPRRKALDCTWVLRVKTNAEGRLERRKTRFVIKGFQQREGIDFQEVFAPVAKAPTLPFVAGRLNKAIYGLKQAPRCWYAMLVEALEALGFKVSDESLFMTEGGEEKEFLLVYVDVILLFSPSLERIKEVQGKLKETFQCKALGPVGYYLGLQVERNEVKGWLRLHQHKYLATMGEKYGLEEGRSVKTPLPSEFQLHLDEEEGEVLEYELQHRFQSLVASLMYASVNTRPNIAYFVSQLARVVSRPLQEHLDAAERQVRYCMATSRVGLQYSVHGQMKQKGVEEVSTKTGAPARRGHLYLSCFTDATWASDISDATSHGGYICCVAGKGPKAWTALKGVHAPATAAIAVVLERQMTAQRIEEDEAVEEGVQKFFDLLTRLEGADLNYSELQKKTKLLALLPESWSSLIINLHRNLPRLSLEEVKRAILQEDFRRRELASADGAGAASIGRGYGHGRGRGQGGGRSGSNNFNGGRGSGGYGSDNKNYGRCRGRFDGECHYCHKSGDMWRDCYKLPDGWTPAQGQEGRGAGGGRRRGRGGRGGRGGGAASMKSAGNESESRDDRFPGQFFFVSTQAPAGPEKDEGFEEPAAVGKVTLHSLDYWVIDSRATYSMTPRADLLTELEPSPVKHVTSALGQRAEVKGMGKAMFKGADGKMVGLKNVLWVPNLAANLISVRRLQKAGMDTSSKGAKTYTARLGERILWDLHEDRDVYNEMWQIPVVPMPKERQVAASISTKCEAVGCGDGANGRAKEIKSKKCNLRGTSKLGEHEESGAAAKKQHKDEENPKAAVEEDYGENMWGTIANATFSNPTSATGECDWLTLHRRMGHVALPILQQIVKNEMVAGIRVKGEPDEVLGCPTCMQAKFTRYPYSSSEATAKAPLDEVVMDVVGPLKLGAAGAEYFLTILDVYTRMTWVYVLSKKSDVAETVKTDWLPMVERQQDRLVKAIRTDRGGEFLSKDFSLWLKKNGIRHSLTMPYSPAMNGIAERANRTITETAHGLLIEAGLPDYFWPDAVRSACVAKNRALNHVGADKWVAYVEWIGRKPKVDMLRVFGCMCMALVPKHLRHNKLGAKAIWAPWPETLIVGDDEESDYEECAFAFFSLVEMPGEPATLKEALEISDAEEWKKAMESELKSIEEKGTWELVELPKGRKAITSKWFFKIKSDADGKIECYKSRFVAKGYQQKEKVDYKDLFAPVVKSTMLRTLLAGAAIKGWVVKQMDETTAFLNGVLEEEIFMAQPEGYDDESGRVLRLKKAIYGLKQTPRQWYLKLRGVLEEIGFTPSSADHSLFMLGEGEQRSFMVVYVDDILIFSPSSDLVKEVMLKLQDKFKCKALGDVSFYLGLHIERDVEKRCMRVHQRKYLEALAAKFGRSEGHVATPFPSGFKCVKGPEEESVGEEERRRFHSLVGSLMYAAVNTRPDVAFATGQLARVVQCPNEEQVAAEMRVANYLGQTPTVGLQYSAAAQRHQKGADGVEPGRLFLTAFSDASCASEPEDMTSVGGFICCVGGGPTARESKKQVDQALSSVESEYMALFRAVQEIVWQWRLLAEFGEEKQGPTPL
ncbi:unnamed protein product [Closterium sp. NIES-53]